MASPGWANVTDDLLFLLAERLISAPTLVRFSAVCKPWHSIASATKCCKLVPWLMLIEKEGSDLRDFYDHSTKELYHFSVPHIQRTKIFGFANGWLITGEEDGSFHLVNFQSKIKISLPPAPFIINYFNFDDEEDDTEENYDENPFRAAHKTLLGRRNLVPIKATCSQIGPDKENIVVLTYRYRFLSLAICHLPSQKWTLIEDDGSQEVAFIDGVFYIVSSQDHVSILDFTPSPKLIRIADLPPEVTDQYNSCYTINSHIVKCGDDILIGVKMYGPTTEEHLLEGFRLLKLDIDGKKVVDVVSIGDYALFFGTNDSFCLPSTSYGGLFRRNCIYFTNIDEFINFDDLGRIEAEEDMMVYNLDDQSFTTYSVGASKSSYSYPIWVLFNPLE